MTPTQSAAGWCVFVAIWMTAIQTVPPIAVGHRPAIAAPMNCPALHISQGVGSDLKTYRRAVDLCDLAERK